MRKALLAAVAATALLAACTEPATDTAGTATPAGDATTTAATVSAASFDCATATEEVQKLICSNPHLARMDQEMHRVWKASEGKPATIAPTQADWTLNRDECRVEKDVRLCVAWAYAERIDQIRRGSKPARETAGGISEGPVAYRCKGMDALISATFVNADPSVVVLLWANEGLLLTQEASGSGAKYTGKNDDGEASFRTKGEEGMLTLPGKPEMTCAEEIIG